MNGRSLLSLFLLLGISFSLAWYLIRRERGSLDTAETHESSGMVIEKRGACWRAVDTRSGVMGSRFSIEVAAPDADIARSACAAGYARIQEIESRLSTWRPDSTLSRLNEAAHLRPFLVDDDTISVLIHAEEWFTMTGGAFDPTVGPIIELWRQSVAKADLPDEAVIDAALNCVGMKHVTLDAVAPAVSFKRPGVALDLGGIAKGYAAKAAVGAALDAGASACRVNAGGDHVAFGRPPWQPLGFPVTIRDPRGGPTDTLDGLSFFLDFEQSVATSGNYERFTEVDGRRYSHIIDPATGWPVENPVVQVTVVAVDGAEADALATAFTVLGVTKGMELARELPAVEALFIVARDGVLERIATDGFPGAHR